MGKLKNTEDMNGTGYEWEYAKKIDNRTTGQKIVNFIYNPETHAVLGRTAKSWGGLLLFYVIFYSVLALLFAICMKVLLKTIEGDSPKWQLAESIIGTSPGLGFRPMANDTEAASIIRYDESNKQQWIDTMWNFEKKYYMKNFNNIKNCTYGEVNLQKGEVCRVSMDSFQNCAPRYGYGYATRTPCVFIKLNRIYGWVPDCYNTTESLPKGIPKLALGKIKQTIEKGQSNQVWLSCEGQSPHDEDNIGDIEYYPAPGFPYYFYPYLNTEGYMSPLVAVHFTKPKAGVIINIECKAWAKNIVHKINAQVREGSVHFELLVD